MQDLLFEQSLNADTIATLINIRVLDADPGFTGRFVHANEIGDFVVQSVKHNFNDVNKRQETLRHVYQSIVGGF